MQTLSEWRRELRRHFRRRRRGLSENVRRRHASIVARHLATSGLILSKGCFGLYLSNHADGELDTAPLLHRLQQMHKTLALPVVANNNPRDPSRMDFYLCRPDSRFAANRFGILEPAPPCRYAAPQRLSVLFVPLVAFDNAGNRIGMGKGFYDRFIGRIAPVVRPKLVGLAHEIQRSSQLLPIDHWDVSLDAVVTETGLHRFR
jgi:5-formyltetrahydrofolate cyclo-ligase